MVGIHCAHHVNHVRHGAKLSALSCGAQESQADHSHVSECQSGICHYHCDHQSKEKAGSKKESIKTIKTDETLKTSVSLYLHPVQCSICYMHFHCVSFHVTQSIIISIILLDSRLELSRVISLSSVASVVSFSCRLHLQNGSSTSAYQWSGSSSCQVNAKHDSGSRQEWGAQQLCSSSSHPSCTHQVESTQKDQELQRVMEQVTVNTQPNRDEHLLKCLIKTQMADHPQQWDDHCGDIRYFIGSFKYFQGDFETLFKVSQGHDRYYLALSESEYVSWQTYGWIRSPRLSNELTSPQDQVFRAIHMFNRIGDAINHLYYLRVAHGFMFNCHSESGHGRYYIYSGKLRGKVEDIPEVSGGVKGKDLAHSHRSGFNVIYGWSQVQEGQASSILLIPSDLVSRDGDVHLSDCFIVHDSARVVSWVSCDFKLVPLRDHLGDHAASASQTHWKSHQNHSRQSSSHGSSSHIRRRIPSKCHRIGDWPQLHRRGYAGQPLGIKESASSSMEVEDSAFKRGWQEELRFNSRFSRPHDQFSSHVSELGLVTAEYLKFKASSCESAWSAVKLTIIVYWAKVSSAHIMRQQASALWLQPQRERVKIHAHTLPHGSRSQKRGSLSGY